MLPELVRDRILEGLPGSEVHADGDGSRMLVRVVSSTFEDTSRVKRQQMVYACIDELIRDGSLHAVTIQALSPAEGAVDG